MKYATVCSGVEAMTLAVRGMGWEPVFFSEVAPFPSAVLAHHYPNVPNLGDMTQIEGEVHQGKVDVLAGGTPCFPKDTLVLRNDGFVPIQDIKVGDLVATHKGRLRKVLCVGNKKSKTGVLKIKGFANLVECTNEHPIYTAKRTQKFSSKEKKYKSTFSDFDFVAAKNTVGLYATSLCGQLDSQIPVFPSVYKATDTDIIELIGWYLGDGCVCGNGQKNKTTRLIQLSINYDKLNVFENRFSSCINYHTRPIDDTRIMVIICCTELARFAEKNFGKGAANKKIPFWCYALSDNDKKALFAGYMATDGHKVDEKNYTVTSISKPLIFGIQMLMECGSVNLECNDSTKIIKGSLCHTKKAWKYSYRPQISDKAPHSSWKQDGFVMRLVHSFKETDIVKTVYNIEVEEDNSYVSAGIVVHNCQSFSVAGNREGLDDPRGSLMLHFARLAHEIRPRYVVWENVPGCLSSNGGEDFAALLSSLCGYDVEPPREGWQTAGYVESYDGETYGLAWRVLDAQYVRVDGHPRAVPQQRRRVWLVGHIGDWRRAASVLFVGEGVSRNPPARRGEQKGTLAVPKSYAGETDAVCSLSTGQSNASVTMDVCGTLSCNHEAPIVGITTISMMNDHSRASVNMDVCGTLLHNQAPIIGRTVSGKDVYPTLCSSAGMKGWQGNQECYSGDYYIVEPGIASRVGGHHYKGVSGTIRAHPGDNAMVVYGDGLALRRLTPLECERLQGFPDNYTRIPWNGKPAEECADGHRYAACGNSWAVNCARWVMCRIEWVEQEFNEYPLAY